MVVELIMLGVLYKHCDFFKAKRVRDREAVNECVSRIVGMREHYPKIEKAEDDICRQQCSYKPVTQDYHLPDRKSVV